MPDKQGKAYTPAGGSSGFGGLPEGYPDGKPARYSVLPVPYDLTVSYVAGTRKGPGAIIEASTHMELYDEELGCEPAEEGIETLPPVEPTALGPEEMIKRVKAAAAEILKEDKVPVMLGGEHSVTLGVVEALLDRYADLSVLQLDAHADMRDSYMDSPYNHACVARRISELCPIVQLGIRSLSVEEASFLDGARSVRGGRNARKPRITTRYAPEVLKAVSARRVKGLLKGLTDHVYVTVDIDAFDPSVMPSTGTPEPGGLLWYDVLAVLSAVTAARKVVGFDLVELCPQPGNVAPDFLAAKLVYRMIGYISRGSAGSGKAKGGGFRTTAVPGKRG